MAWLEDYRDAMLRAAMQAFLVGDMDKMMIEEWRGRCKMCDELMVLKLNDILRWYFGENIPTKEGHV